jgi:uncharacterized membrane protein HdeD (DUF308 family)
MTLPTNPDFWRKLVLCAILMIAAGYLLLTTGTIPAALLAALITLVTILMGVSTQATPPDGTPPSRRDSQ